MTANSGKYRDTGSVKANRPSSYSTMTATPVTALVIEKMRKMASFCIGWR
jgi:hypothetical protein